MSKRRVKRGGSVCRRKYGRYMGEYSDFISGKKKQEVATKLRKAMETRQRNFVEVLLVWRLKAVEEVREAAETV